MAVELKYVARGIGGVDEMSIHLDDTKVLFGILRFVFGKGTFARIKYVAALSASLATASSASARDAMMTRVVN